MREGSNLEFKETWRDEYLKTLAAFANSSGGEMLIGVDDKGRSVGAKNSERLLEELPNKIRDKLGLITSVEVEDFEGREIVKVAVKPSFVPVSYNGKFYVRTGSTVQELKGNELIQFILKRQNLSWDALPSKIGVEEIDTETVERFKTLATKRLPDISEADSVEKVLSNLDLIENGKLRNAGVLLFGKNPQKHLMISEARVGKFKSDIDILDTVTAKGNLFKQLDILFDAVKKHLNVKYVIKGQLEREDVWDYPLDAVREAIINALIHRDYLDNADIQIRVYDDKIRFWNPGLLPEGITIDMLRTDHESRPRNKLLAMIFYFAGLIERWGSGTKRMIDLCRAQELPEPEFREEGAGFAVIFYKDIYTEENLRKMGLNERQIKAVMYVKEKGKIAIADYKEISPDVSKKTLYRDLQGLVKKEILHEVGDKKGRRYELR